MRWAAYVYRLTIFAVAHQKNLRAFARRTTTNAKPITKMSGSVCGCLQLTRYSHTLRKKLRHKIYCRCRGISPSHSVKKGNLKNGTGENYVDLFRESDGAYLGSYFLNYGELESCVIEKGELVLLIHVKGEGRCFIQWTGVNVLGGEGAGGFGFDSGALAGTTGISKSDLEILSAYSVSLANSELVFLEDAKQTTADDAITGRYFNKLESKLGSKAGKPVKLYWFGKDRGKADYEGDLKRKLKGAVLYDREYEISESGDSIKITLKQRKAHEIMRDAFGLDPNASYVNATTKMTATEITGSDSDSATGSISGSGSASSTQDGIQKSIEWARNIAADDRFTYGKGYGDYYDCPVCHGSTKKSELKYTCNPFVAAAFAHGTGDPLLMNHGNHKVRTSWKGPLPDGYTIGGVPLR